MLGGFFEEDYAGLGSDLQQVFAELLEQQDPLIFDWLMGAEVAENPEFAQLVQMMRKKYKLE